MQTSLLWSRDRHRRAEPIRSRDRWETPRCGELWDSMRPVQWSLEYITWLWLTDIHGWSSSSEALARPSTGSSSMNPTTSYTQPNEPSPHLCMCVRCMILLRISVLSARFVFLALFFGFSDVLLISRKVAHRGSTYHRLWCPTPRRLGLVTLSLESGQSSN